MAHKLKSILIFLFVILSNQTLYGKDNDSKILVIGGTGRIGSEIVKELSINHSDITVMSRAKRSKDVLDGYEIKFVKADVLDEKEVARVFQSHKYDVVINSIAKVNDDKNPHAHGQINLNKWSKDSGVKHFILIGSVGASQNQGPLVSDFTWKKWGETLKSKGLAEESLIKSGITYTVIRTGIIIYDDTPSTGNGQLSSNHTIVGKITRKDLAIQTVGCIMKSKCKNKIFHALDKSLEK